MTRLIVATRNAHKTREFAQILGNEFEITDLSGVIGVPEIKETGCTIEENAVLKAVVVSQDRHELVVADDSGLEVDALRGAPGIYSARYAGENATDKQNIDKLLSELARRDVSANQRSARFRCVIALARGGKLLRTFEGVVEGTIVDLPRGSHGFGYDPVFVPNGLDKTFGELPADLKNQISHRARAIRVLRAGLATLKPGD
jgi:XTP/dITP diphosphohydrolase